MTAKRFVRKTFRIARKRVCRYIVGFDRCPIGYRKNYKQIILDGLTCIVLILVSTIAFSAMILMC